MRIIPEVVSIAKEAIDEHDQNKLNQLFNIDYNNQGVQDLRNELLKVC